MGLARWLVPNIDHYYWKVLKTVYCIYLTEIMMRVFQNLMAKWLLMLYVCNKVVNYTAVGNTDGATIKYTYCLQLSIEKSSKYVERFSKLSLHGSYFIGPTLP